MQLGAVEAAIASTAQATHGLHPAEDLFDPLAHPLAYRIAGMPRGATVERGTTGATFIARDVRGDLERAARGHELSRVVALVGTEGYPPAPRQRGLQHRACAFALCVAVSRFDRELDKEAVAVLHQRVGRVTQLRFLARALLRQLRFGVGGRLMSRVAAALAVEVHRRVAGVDGRLAQFPVLAVEALERRLGLDQRTVHGEVLVRKQLQAARLGDHAGEKLARHVVLQQPRPVAREARVVKARLGHLHIEEPAEQQVVIDDSEKARIDECLL
jgi:hypothetical protein